MVRQAHYRSNREFVIGAIRDRAHFRAIGNMMGRSGGGLASDHQLSGAALAAYEAALEDGSIRYTIYSYATPIAWVTADGKATVPEVFYSKTTSRQQNIVRQALS